MKKALLFLASTLCGLASCYTAPPMTPAELHRHTLESIVFIDSDESTGSGTILNDHCVLTAEHLVAENSHQKIIAQDQKEYSVTQYYKAEFSDLAVMCVKETWNYPAVKLNEEMPKQYEPIFVIGNPIGIHNILTTGNYQGDDSISAPITFGNSGGGAFDEQGHLIGIVIAVAIKEIQGSVFIFPHLGKITTLRDIIPFLQENQIPFEQVKLQ